MPDYLDDFDSNDSEALERVYALLDRQTPITALSALNTALQQSQSVSSPKEARKRVAEHHSPDSRFALGFDTSAIFNLTTRESNENAIDYLSAVHKGPLVLPGQVIQEAWKNAITASHPYAERLKKAVNNLRHAIESIDISRSDAAEMASKAVNAFADEHGDWVDPSSENSFINAISGLESQHAVCKFVPRARFYNLAVVRKNTKTPPGFDDSKTNYGDFFVWADFLYGLATCDLANVDRIVFVTNDKKSDWSRNSVPHPILVAEVESLTSIPFDLLDLDGFVGLVEELT